jgi:hypothetical protein
MRGDRRLECRRAHDIRRHLDLEGPAGDADTGARGDRTDSRRSDPAPSSRDHHDDIGDLGPPARARATAGAPDQNRTDDVDHITTRGLEHHHEHADDAADDHVFDRAAIADLRVSTGVPVRAR